MQCASAGMDKEKEQQNPIVQEEWLFMAAILILRRAAREGSEELTDLLLFVFMMAS